MPKSTDSLIAGHPRFIDSRLATLAREQGLLAAWQAAVAGGAETAPRGVDGDFAVALREPSGRCFLAVDRFAISSLCYRQEGDTLHFAERADELAGAAGEIDPQAIFDYLFCHVIPSPRTIFKGIYRLPPGHYALFEHGQLTVAPYWVPTFTEPRQPSFAQLKDEFRQLLADSVSAQIGDRDPSHIGCFLSGGTDSSTVAGMVSQVSGQPAATYSIGFDAAGYDEMEFARIAARHFGTRHHEYYVTPDDLVRSITDVATHYDQPFGNSSSLPAYYCAKVARGNGVEKMLAGDGGDELFGGNSRYAKQRIFGWYGRLPSALRRGVMEPLFELPALARTPVLKKGASYIEQAKVPMPDRMHMYNLLLRLGLTNVLQPGFLDRIDVDGPAKQQRKVWSQAVTENPLNRVLAFDWRYTLAENDLPKVRGTTDLAGVEVGFPMLERRLLEFSLGLPAEYKLKGLKLRWFFKEALRGFLPDEIITKKKQGFGLPFGVWATQHTGLRNLAADSLRSLASRGIVRPAFIDELLGTHLPAFPGYYGEMVWILMMLEQWIGAKAPAYRLT